MTARALPAPSRPVLSSPVLAVAIFVFTEAMLFAGLVSAYIVLRGQYAGVWPPVGQPRLPVAITGFSTAVLCASGVTMWLAVRALARGRGSLFARLLTITLVCGAAFLVMQGREWASLIEYGMGTNANLYGSLFYTIVGAHALHVLGAVVALAIMSQRASRNHYTPESHDGMRALRAYWTFVVVVWPPLYGLVFLW